MMSFYNYQRSSWVIMLLICLVRAQEETQMEQTTVNITEPKNDTTKDLYALETADPKKVDIVKQIRRLNDDGSYTVGYEAGDGTFKIESRDVQGNIKGTFGYVDSFGEIKRVSYSTSNTTQAPLLLPILQTTRFNRTLASSTTRRPQPTVVYSKNSSPTRPTVIQPIPRRRPINSVTLPNTITTTESYRTVSTNSQPLNTSETTEDPSVPKIVKQFPIFTPRTTAETIKAVLLSEADPSETKTYQQNGQQKSPQEANNTATPVPSFLRSTLNYEKTPERTKENPKTPRGNTFRRQLHPTNFESEQMFAFQQSAGDDTTDVYGGSVSSIGTSRPLFTTTTGRPRLIPLNSILAARHKLNEKIATSSPQISEDQQESTLEATTNKLNEGNYVTTNPVPIIQIPITNDNGEQRVIERPFIKQHPSVVHFRTRDFLRDNPGAPVPIGNQRIYFRYNPNIPVDENGQYVRQPLPPPIPPPNNYVPVPNHINMPPENVQPDMNQDKPNLIAIPVQPVPVQQIPVNRFQYYNPYIQPMRIENLVPPPIEFKPINTPVSTKDLRRLLQQLLIRQNRLQTLMDIRNDYNPQYNVPYNNQQGPLFEPDYRQKPIYGPRPGYQHQLPEARPINGFVRQIGYNPNYPYQPIYTNQQNPYTPRNDYRAQDDGYRNEITAFDPGMPYESQRFIPKRRAYRPRVYEQRYEDTNMIPENQDDQEYLPPEVRETLLLKMLMLAINPDFNPALVDHSPLATTQTPEYRKKVRNVQILGEESDAKEMEHKRQERT